MFPIPGSQYNPPKTQITFRGTPVSTLGPIQVVGSRSGAHAGALLADSDGQGGSFFPSTPFVVGETVTVSTQLNVIDAHDGQFSFRVEKPAPSLPPATLARIPAGANGLQHFRSRGDLQPASIIVSRNTAPASSGDIFVAPQFGPSQNGPMILDSSGRLVWFQPTPVSRKTLIAHEFGFVNVELTSQGMSMLAHAAGHQLRAHVTITGDGQTSGAEIALIPFR